MTSFSGGEIRMGDPGGISPGTPIGYRMVVTKTGERRYGAEACATEIEPLLRLLRQFEELGYEFVRLERTYGN